uniref:Uncharacterized protein n=1 Tax=Faecalibaculum rodentium TaxID=1702221 RepID=A0A140DX99_9FIRM|nr:hypothetical protein AALO17_21420 [Faecalibaculum rodentium]
MDCTRCFPDKRCDSHRKISPESQSAGQSPDCRTADITRRCGQTAPPV